MEFYLVYTESSQFAGGGQWFITKAESVEDAKMIVEPVANEYWYEMDRDEFEKCMDEEFGEDEDSRDAFEESACTILDCYAFTAESLKNQGEECWADYLSKPGLGGSVELHECTEVEVMKAAEKVQLDLVG